MIVDANMYWFPEEIFSNENLMDRFLSEISSLSEFYGYETTLEKGQQQIKQIVIEKPKGYQNLNYAQNDYILEKQLVDMDQAGINKAVLKLPGCQEWLSLELCKRFNDGMSEHVRKSNERMVALAVLPPSGSRECIYELERCMNKPGIVGIQITTHYGNSYLDDAAFAPFFEKLNKMECTVYVHHSPVPVEYGSLLEYNNLRRQYGRCVDQATAVGREIFSGFFDKYPRLKMVHSMLGGGFFTYVNMMMPHTPKKTETVNRFDANSDAMSRYLKDNLFFEMSQAQSWGKTQLECAISVLGADHILFGSSYPVRREWLLEGAEFVKQLNVSSAEKELILSENARTIYHA
jgi:predicted TIM-barrel fold metal-dependent hydrolase